jgi:hypothetical protein
VLENKGNVCRGRGSLHNRNLGVGSKRRETFGNQRESATLISKDGSLSRNSLECKERRDSNLDQSIQVS